MIQFQCIKVFRRIIFRAITRIRLGVQTVEEVFVRINIIKKITRVSTITRCRIQISQADKLGDCKVVNIDGSLAV